MNSMIGLNKQAWEEAQRRVIVSNLKALNTFPSVLNQIVIDYAVEGGLDNATNDSKIDPAFEALVQKFMPVQKTALKEEKGLLISIKFYLHKIYDWVIKQINKIKNLISPKKTINTSVTMPDTITQKTQIPPAIIHTNNSNVESNMPFAESSDLQSNPDKTNPIKLKKS